MKHTLRVFSFFTISLLTLAPRLAAQATTGAIEGTVVDSSGAAVRGATVKVVSSGTNLTITAETTPQGSYQVPNLPIGAYTVTISSAGFKTESHTAILVEGNRTTTVDAKLEVGAAATTVEVTATPLLNHVDTSMGYVLGELAINSTPLGTGSFTQLAILAPGVSADLLNTSGTNAGLGNQAIWANGQRDTSNSFSLNGLTTNNLFNGKSTSQVASSRFTANTGAFGAGGNTTSETNTAVYDQIGQGMATPPAETIEEIRVNTAMYDASQGGKSGAQIAVMTKSGTNDFQGELYDHFQNSAMNAAEFFRNASTAIAPEDKVAKLHYNRFGATLGGPLKHDKLFFFAAYQGLKDTDALSGSSSLTVPLHLTDDRSPQALVNVAQLDFNKTITASQIDPAAFNLLNFKIGNNYLIPSAQITDPTTAAKLGYDVYLQQPSTFFANQANGSMDYIVSSKDRLTGKYYFQSNPTVSPFADSNTSGFASTVHAGSQTFTLENTVILSPTLSWQQKVGFVRSVDYKFTAQPASPLDIGINAFGSATFPGISIGTADNTLRKRLTIGSTFSGANSGVYQNQFSYGTNVNWVRGRHTISAGFNWDHNQLNIINQQNNAGVINFNLFTDFLAGNVTSGSSTRFTLGASNRYMRADLAGAYVQDNIRVTSRLTVNLGLRYDRSGPFTEQYGHLTSFHPDAYNYDATTDTITNTGLVVAGNNAALGTPGVTDSTLTGRQWGIGPRVGIVWSPPNLNNLVVRTGFGIFYDRGEYFTELSPGFGPGGVSGPFGTTVALPFVQQVNATSAGTLSNPFAGATIPPVVTNQTLFANLLPNAAQIKSGMATYVFGGYDPTNVLPYTENWTFDVQWQPRSSTWVLDFGYVGNRSLHQILPIPFNQPGIATPTNPIHGETSSYGFNAVPSIETVKSNSSDGGNTSLRSPYLGLSPNSVLYKAEGIATYNAFQFGLTKRLSHGLQLTGSYTWSHTLDEQSGLGLFFNGNDPLNLRSSYGTATYDRTHVVTVQYLYQLPKVTQMDRSLLGRVGNGWALNGVTIFESGFPYNAFDFSGAVAGELYSHNVNIIDPILPLKPGTTVQQAILQGTTGFDVNKPFLDANAFYIPTLAPGQNGVPPCTTVNGNQVCDTVETGFGATGRNTFRGPFQWRADVSAQKVIMVNDKILIRFQADAFNVFNHPSFDAPNVSSSLYNTNFSTNIPTARAPSSSFGFVSRTLGSPRFIQLSLSLKF
jgi:hypothetical protein